MADLDAVSYAKAALPEVEAGNLELAPAFADALLEAGYPHPGDLYGFFKGVPDSRAGKRFRRIRRWLETKD